MDPAQNIMTNNPLRYLSNAELRRLSDEFARLVDNEDPEIELFWRAARAARNPRNAPNGAYLREYERTALTEEAKGFFAQTKILRISVITMCFSAMIQGWVQTGSNGSNQDWPHEFGLIDLETGLFIDQKSTWIFAAINALPYLAAGLGGCWISDPLQSMVLGRRGAIFVSGCVCMAALIGSACTRNWQQLLICRTILGIGLGAKASTTPISSAEISPSHLRGALVMNWQFFVTIGLALGFTANLILFRVGALAWRLQISSACVPTLILLTLILTIPESPRWYLKKGKFDKAFEAIIPLRETRLQAARDVFYANQQIQAEEAYLRARRPEDPETSDLEVPAQVVLQRDAEIRNSSFFRRFWQLIQEKRTRRATVASACVMLGQQLCGMNVLAFYSSTFFRDVNGIGGSPVQAVWFSWGVGIANCLFTIPAYAYIDKIGRRLLLLATQPFMTIFMLGACLSFLATNPKVRLALVGLFLFLFIAAYSIGQGPVAFAYSSEAFPLIYREVGMSFAVFVNLVGAGLLTLFVPLAQMPQAAESETASEHDYALGQTKLLGCFVALNFISILLNFTFVRETQGLVFKEQERSLIYLSLEDLNSVFNVKTWDHFAYQCREVSPFALKWITWVLRLCLGERPDGPREFFHWLEEEEIRKQRRANEKRQHARTMRCPSCHCEIFEHFESDQDQRIRCIDCQYAMHFTIRRTTPAPISNDVNDEEPQNRDESTPLAIDHSVMGRETHFAERE